MRNVRFELQHENFVARRLSPGLNVVIPEGTPRVQGLVLPIAAGSSDEVHVFHQDDEYLVCSVNYVLGYASLEVFDSGGDPIGDVFLESKNLASAIGPNGIFEDIRDIALAIRELV